MATSNAYLYFNGERFPLYVTSLSYPLKTLNKKSSQSRQGYTIYPYRVMRGEVSVKARFRSREEYRQFGTFMAKYHKSVTGDGYGIMRFVSEKMVRTNRGSNVYGISPSKKINYGVTIERIDMTFAYDMDPAPEISFSMYIIDDEYVDITGESEIGNTGKSAMDGVGIVTSGLINSHGDGAYAG